MHDPPPSSASWPASWCHGSAWFGRSLWLASLVLACADDDGDEDPPSGGSGSGGAEDETSAGDIETRHYILRLDDAPVPPVVLDLDKDKALEVFGTEAAKDIELLELDSTDMLGNVIDAIQNACGTTWRNNNPNPGHDCSRTPLGQTFGTSWQRTPEFALVRLLGMTPANAVVRGTSLADFQDLVDGNPETFAFEFSDVLSASMGIDETDPFIPTEQLVRVLQESLLGSHPAIANTTGTIPITMYDALLDMAPLAEKLGPVGRAPWDEPGEHPGVLVPDDSRFTTKSDALLPTFRMRVTADSKLRRVSGVVLGEGEGDMFVMEGSTPIAIDFMDPDKFQIEGIADEPTVDMRFAMREVPSFVSACTDTSQCRDNLPPPLGRPIEDTIWSYPQFLLEPIVTRSAYLTYAERTFSQCYLTLNGDCLVGVDIGDASDPAGWAVFTNSVDGVEVPAPQYLWELLNEVAQVALHNPTGDGIPEIVEGNAEPVFALSGVPIGMTGADLVARMRPTLQEQADEIANLLVGKYWTSNDPLDFYYRRATPDGDPYLFFVAETDIVPGPGDSMRPYTYTKPGFYADPGLTERVSAKTIAGVDDTVHEKYRLTTGHTILWAQDSEGRVYELRFFVPEGTDPVEIVAEVNAL